MDNFVSQAAWLVSVLEALDKRLELVEGDKLARTLVLGLLAVADAHLTSLKES